MSRTFKHILPVLACLTVAMLTVSCSDSDEPAVEQQAVITPASRTILVYMVANNSLGYDQCDASDIREMLAAAAGNSFNGGRLIVYHAPTSGNPALKEITPSGVTILSQYDTGMYSTDPQRIRAVISDVKALAPADDYGLILWSHASAWVETSMSKSTGIITATAEAFGEDRSHSTKISSLADVLTGEGFSFIYFDCCHMASIEVVYELKDVTPLIIGSATEIPKYGMPYDKNIPLLFNDVPDFEEVCRNTFEDYDSRNDKFRTCTISLIDTGHLDELASVSREIFEAGTTLPDEYTPQAFVLGECYLYDLADYMHALAPDDDTKSRWDEALDKVVLYKASTPKIFDRLQIDTHCGLGCYIVDNPSASNYKGYDNQSWWKDVVSHHFNLQ